MRLGWPELVVLLVLILLLFGWRRLPAVGRSLGQCIREFRRSLPGGRDRDHDQHTRGSA